MTISTSTAERARRRALSVPTLRYPADLPITERRAELLDVLRDHQVVIVAGETGSGKSTQLPKLCLELGRGIHGMIGHTQPRRVAARSVAERVAEELGSEVGGLVGYTVRFTDRASEATLVKVMTDGILLAEIQRDRLLRRYDTLIIDEAHERSLNIDFLLGYLHGLLPRRRDLKVVITSATIDTARFAEHFGGAPVVEVSGRAHPVEVRYRPYGLERDDDRDQVHAVCDAVEELCREGPGDILVFLSGEREIRDAAEGLRHLQLRDTELLPLYARLSAAEQHRIFERHRGRRIVLATNVAETSITVPGVRYVVDTGTARISRYSRRLKVQRLPIEPVSKASARQRAGRCGRVAPGICIRLYAEEDFEARPEFTEPEILRTNLASVILQMAALGLGEVSSFPFVEPPDARSVKDGVALLEELGAFDPGASDPGRRLTPLGRRLARLPLDPRLGRMVLEAERHGCVREVAVIAAALSIQDPRERPTGEEQAAAELHARFADPDSDFLTFLHLWDHLREQQRQLSGTQFRKLCRAEHLNYLRVREWQDIFSQVRQIVGDLGVRMSTTPGHPDHVHRALLAGLLSHVGMRDGTSKEFKGARNARFAIARGSVLHAKPPRWVMVGELVETNRLWGRVAARIQPEWVERVGSHLVQRTYSEPHWDAGRGAVMAMERVTLYGLPLVARRVGYGRVDPALARELFIRHALVEGDWDADHRFLADNQALVAQVQALEHRVRRGDILVDDDALWEFFDERLPANVTSGRHFDTWWKRTRESQPDLLRYTSELLVSPRVGAIPWDHYPDRWEQGDLVLALTYCFEPGAPDDGVTVHVPVEVLGRLRPDGFDWHVPGLREELVTALIRTLPKPLRRHVVPVAAHARSFLDRHGPHDGSLLEVLGADLGRQGGVVVAPDAFDVERLPAHLRVTFAVVDRGGAVVGSGKDLAALQHRFRLQARSAIAAATDDVERSGLTSWTLGTLPRVVRVNRAGLVVEGYPALVDEGSTAGVRVFANERDQERAMRVGTRRLLMLVLPSPRKVLRQELDRSARLAGAMLGVTAAELADDCLACVIDHLVSTHGGPAWDGERFESLADAARLDLVDTAVSVAGDVGRAFVELDAVERRLRSLTAPTLQPSVIDVRSQLDLLVYPGFVTVTGARRLPDLVRYLRAVDRRLEKLPSAPARDQQAMVMVRRLEQAFDEAAAPWLPGPFPAEIDEVRWMLEELRVSVFAQVVGTAYPVSEPRVRRAIERLAALR